MGYEGLLLLTFCALSFAHSSERLLHNEAIFSDNSFSLTLNTASDVGNASKVSKDTFEYKLPNTPLYSGNT